MCFASITNIEEVDTFRRKDVGIVGEGSRVADEREDVVVLGNGIIS